MRETEVQQDQVGPKGPRKFHGLQTVASDGNFVAEQLKHRYDLRVHYHHTIPEQPPVDDIVIADVSVYEQIAPAMEGIEAIVWEADPETFTFTFVSPRATNERTSASESPAARKSAAAAAGSGRRASAYAARHSASVVGGRWVVAIVSVAR